MKTVIKGKKKNELKMIKVLCLIMLVCMTVSLTACHSTKLAEGYDKNVIKKTAEEVINDVQLRGAKVVLTERMREDCLENIDLDTMENTVVNLTKGKGAFMVYSKETVVGRYHEDLKEDLAVILVTATYEKGEVNYTISFDKDMKVVGFYAN